MVYDLLQNYDKVVDEVFVVGWIFPHLIQKVVKGTRHDTGVFIAQCLFHLLVHHVDRSYLMELIKYHYRLLPDHLVSVIKKFAHGITDCHHDILIAELTQAI